MIFRIDVTSKAISNASGQSVVADPLGQSVRQQILEFGSDVGEVTASRVYLIEAEASAERIRQAAADLLADPVVEQAELFDSARSDARSRIEIHLKPGVMDPVANSAEMALRDWGLGECQVRTGRAYLLGKTVDRKELETIASRVLANGVIESVHFEPFVPVEFPHGHHYTLSLRQVKLCALEDEQLKKLSREGHLFLSLTEMKAVQDYFRRQKREPTDIELETIAQTWSEHCVHKTLKSAVEVFDTAGQRLRSYRNLIKETIFASTMKLVDRQQAQGEPFCLSVFKDNAGVVVFDELDAVCFKVETHNHPSAIEPYGGSATGIGGCIRDVMGTGLSAKPVANTDVFCVAYPDTKDLPRGVIHPKRILRQIVAGVRDYGNRMGIPTVNGAVYFDPDYLGNPLVFCGCVGLIPRDKIHKAARPGDAVVVMGGRTGRDGIHGATFSSAELTDTHADEFSHAVQIGNAITQKQMLDVILQARDRGLFTAITDCGAGGLSSAVGEMGADIGAQIELDQVPLKYQGLRYDEIWISEAQERMVLSVPQAHVAALLELSRGEDVEATVIGVYGTKNNELILRYQGTEVGRLGMEFLHEGIPMPTRRAVVETRTDVRVNPNEKKPAAAPLSSAQLLERLAHPNIASKHWVIRQYDHEVQGGSVIKPLVGPAQIGPSDAAVIRPKLNSNKGVVIACGMAPQIEDPYQMAIASIDEAVRNAVCVGATLDRLSVLDNFCWPSVDDERTMGTLVRACEACHDAAMVFGVPFISGKDSLHNQFTLQETGRVIRIPRTLLISAMGVLDDVRRCVTMDFKAESDRLLLVRPGGSGLESLAQTHRAVSSAIASGKVKACHDVSDGGWLVAVAEMCIASRRGAGVRASATDLAPFAEVCGAYVLELSAKDADAVAEQIGRQALCVEIGHVDTSPHLTADATDIIRWSLDELTGAWRGTLDW